MANLTLNYFNPSLGKATSANVLLPDPGIPGPYAVFYLLHGFSDDHTVWQRRTSLERYVAGLPVIVVMPDGGLSFYCDDPDGMKWETAIAVDLVKYVDTLFQTRADRTGRCIGGLSMGGYGAVKLALKHPETFASATSHSGAMGFAHSSWERYASVIRINQFKHLYEKSVAGGAEDLFALAEKLDPTLRPSLRIDCGTEDFLLEDNRNYTAHLKSIGYAHEYEEFPGSHEWGYWDTHVQRAIAFHRNLGGW